ncbi:MAG: hypothetical protein WA655_14185 [Candidatus Korobacteraceae bacterium]
MRGASQFVTSGQNKKQVHRLAVILALLLATALVSSAQISGGPPTTTHIGGHALAPPPSVTSLAGRHTPNALPSVTSIPNYNIHFHNGSFNGHYGSRGSRYGGWAYAIPYYYPADDSAYGYDYVGAGAGPDLYSGPPLNPSDPSLHIVAEQPPAKPYGSNYPPDPEAYAPPAPTVPFAPAPQQDVTPGEPTVLVFRNGHQQEVTNYAIMGDSVYVFDKGSKKIALADLDVPATMKANDDRGLEFKVPATPAAKKNSAAPQSTTPDQTATPPAKIAALTQ